MKLGTETGSFTNYVYSLSVAGQPEPVVGMGATVLLWTDRNAATVVAVYDRGKIITVQEDAAKRTDANGMSECQEYEYSHNFNGELRSFRRDTASRWRQVEINPKTGRWNKTECGRTGLVIGKRDHYHDFSF